MSFLINLLYTNKKKYRNNIFFINYFKSPNQLINYYKNIIFKINKNTTIQHYCIVLLVIKH